MQQKRFILIALLVAVLALTACATPTDTAPTAEEPAPAATEAPAEEATAEPAEEPVADMDNTGAWVDEVVAVEEPSASAAVSRMQAGEIDVYAYSVSEADVFQVVQDSSDLAYSNAFGSYNELTLNPTGPVLEDGTLNPFGDPQIREAVNWLIDRDYIVQEIFDGLVKRAFRFNRAFPTMPA
ncbi:MAG: ABC transporter substrate-binding protein [Caldilineaceae bacterium]